MVPKPKSKTSFLCQECGHTSPRWEGRCPACGVWNSYIVFTEAKTGGRVPSNRALTVDVGPMNLGDQPTTGVPRLTVDGGEVDRLLGGGVVAGSLLLMAGEPGIGKSTLLLQMAAHLVDSGLSVLYVSGEESGAQVHLRAQRLGVASTAIQFLAETNVEQMLGHIAAMQPQALIVDSIQTLYSETTTGAAGSVTQVREGAQLLLRWAKESGAPVFLAGHVTKDGSIAGPRVLEHMVDVVLYLEGETLSSYRLLRCTKNRFGATNDVALLEMRSEGLKAVPDPSAVFIGERQQGVSGSAVVVTLEGSRPLLAEVQALTNVSAFNPPRRTSNGIEFNRMVMIAAVLSRRAGLALASQDIMVNVAGGLRIGEPAADLAVALTIASSFRDVPLDPQTVFLGEVGLNGEVRRVPQLERRLAEASRHGFTHALVPYNNTVAGSEPSELELVPVKSLRQAMEFVIAVPGARQVTA
jgi:DNA repair protein RadA/Sms